MTTTAINLGATADPAGDQTQADHDKAMAAKFDATQQAAQTSTQPTSGNPPTTPDDQLIGGKFKSQDDLLAAYKALEAKLGAPKAPEAPTAPAPATPPADPPKDPLQIDPNAANQQVAEAGFKMDDLAAEFTTNGDLKPETYEKLSKAGITKDMVSAYAAGQQALAVQTRNTVFSAVGIKDDAQFTEVTQWAATNLSPAEITAYNAQVGPGATAAQMQLAVEAVYNRFVKANGAEPRLVQGQAAAPGGDSYQSQAQWKADMRDDRYSKDPAFRAAVMAKLGRSNI